MVTSEQSIKKPTLLMPERLLWLVAILLIAGAGFYVGRQNGIGAGLAQRQRATDQFLAERGGNHAGGQQGQGGGQDRFGGQGQAGTVQSVNGNTITIQTSNGATATIQVGDTTAIRKQVAGQVSDIRAGDRIVAFGDRSGDVLQATAVQLGGFGGPGEQGGNHSGQGGQSNP